MYYKDKVNTSTDIISNTIYFLNDMFLEMKKLLWKKVVRAMSIGSLRVGTCRTSQETKTVFSS